MDNFIEERTMIWNKINILKKKEKSSEIYFSDDKNSFEKKDEEN